MKLNIFLVLCCSFSPAAFAQNENIETNNALAPRIGPSVSEQIIALSRSEKVNLLTDATFFSTAGKPLLLHDEDITKKLLKLGYLNTLSVRQLDANTFLLWSEPDTSAVVKSLVADNEKSTKLPQPTNFAFMFSDVENQKAGLSLASYLEQKYAWDGQSANFTADIALSELPEAEADVLFSLASANILKSRAQKQVVWPLETIWVSDKLWQNARVGYFRTPSKELVLAVRSNDGQRDYYAGVNNLVSFPSTKWQPTDIETHVQNDPAGEAIKKLTIRSLRNEKSLLTPVSFEVTDVPLSSVLAEMQKSGVNFESSPVLLSNKRITASLVNMPLRDVMAALTGLYGIVWSKHMNDSFAANSGLSPAQIDALQIGEFQYFLYWKEPLRRPESPDDLDLPPLKDLKTELANAGIEERQLLEPQGIEFSALPENLRNLVRQNVEGQMTPRLIDQYKSSFIDTTELSNIDKLEVSVRVKPSLSRVNGVGVQAINVAPTLNASLVADGIEIYSIGIYNKPLRKAVAARIDQSEALQKTLIEQGQAGANLE